LLGRWRELKEERPDLIIGVGGCVASQEGAAILKRAPFVDLVFGPQTLHRLPAMIREVRAGHPGVVDVSFPAIEKFASVPQATSTRCSAFLSVMEGCSKACSYCIVPTTRGEEISRPLDDVLAEARRLAALGALEITLLCQNVNAYRGARPNGGKADLADLIRRVAEIARIERIRFTTSHPAHFDDALVAAYAEVDKLVSYLHLPVQSGSDRVLKLMKRGYTAAKYEAKIEKLKRSRPGISIATDMIVGFPGESDEDFGANLDYLPTSPLTHLHVFPYSDRPGTIASLMPGKVDGSVTRARGMELRAIGAALTRRFHASQCDTIRPGLTLEDGTLVMTDNYLKVRIPAGLPRNQRVNVRLVAVGGTLGGELVA